MTQVQSDERARAGSGEVLTFLIADVRGYTAFTQDHGDEAAARLAAEFAGVVKEAVEAADGRLIELRGDEALSVFTSARQALRAAVALQEAFRKRAAASGSLPLRVGIGLDSGEAVPVEGGYRGGALNLAARLCSLAGPGEVLASEAVVHLARKVPTLSYSDRGLVQLKGLTDPVRVIQIAEQSGESGPLISDALEPEAPGPALPIARFLGALPEGVLVGRSDELRKVMGFANAARGGSGRLVALVGEPGVGKTRLAQEVTLEVRNAGFIVAAGRCYAQEQAVAFYPFIEAMNALHSAAPRSVSAQILQRWPDVLRLLPGHSTAPTTAKGTREDQQRLFWAVASYIQAVAEQSPVALMLDDLHWADESSLELLQHLARHTRAHPVLLLCTYRNVEVQRGHPLGSAMSSLSRERLIERINVTRMDRDETASLMAATFGVPEVSGEFAELVYRHTEGNAFFVEEVLRALVERGDVYRQNGEWDRRQIDEIEVPESVRGATGERISRLDPLTQEVLSEASVLGQLFHFDDLAGMLGRPESEVEAALEEAAEAGLIRESGRDSYIFNHALIQQTLYSELSSRRKRRLHLAAGGAIETRAALDVEARASDLARHFLEGDDNERALKYSLLAGDRAEALFAHRDAERHYTTALELARDTAKTDQEISALLKLGIVLISQGRFEDALQHLEAGVGLARAAADADLEMRLLHYIAMAHRQRGSLQDAIDRLESAVTEVSPAAEPSAPLAELYVDLARLYFAGGRFQDQLTAATRAADMARSLGNNRILAAAETSLGTALGYIESIERGCSILEHAVGLAEGVDSPFILYQALNNLASMTFDRGDLATSRRYAERLLKLAERIGDPVGQGFAFSNMSAQMYEAGEWEDAIRYAEASMALLDAIGAYWYCPYPRTMLGEVRFAQGRWDEGYRLMNEAVEYAQQTNDLQILGLICSRTVYTDLQHGDTDTAISRLARFRSMSQGSAMNLVDAWALPMEGWANLLMGDPVEAERLVRAGLQVAQDAQWGHIQTEQYRVLGMALRAQRRWEEAAEVFEQGLSLTRERQTPYTEARLLREYGAMFAEQGDALAAERLLRQARSIFERLGAEAYLSTVDDDLAQIG